MARLRQADLEAGLCCLAIKSRAGGGHVGFVVGKAADGQLLILGGNQSNTVSIARYNPSVFEFRWPGIKERVRVSSKGNHPPISEPLRNGLETADLIGGVE